MKSLLGRQAAAVPPFMIIRSAERNPPRRFPLQDYRERQLFTVYPKNV